MDLGGAQTFNALFVRQALTGGLHLDHLKTAEKTCRAVMPSQR